MEIFGYVAAVFIGLILGLIGGGGSILTVPVLVYLFGVYPSLATGYSLFIVGTTSLFGIYSRWKLQEVNVRAALVFGLPSMLMVFATRRWILPMIPNPIFSMHDWHLSKSHAMMLLFTVLMLLAAWNMLRPTRQNTIQRESGKSGTELLRFSLVIQGLVVGLLTGLVGVGGGFLIVPALVMFSKLPMKEAVGTSLLIIAVNSLLGFTGDVWTQGESMDLLFLVSITGLSIVGILLGGQLAKRIETTMLRKAFAWFVLLMGLVVGFEEITLIF